MEGEGGHSSRRPCTASEKEKLNSEFAIEFAKEKTIDLGPSPSSCPSSRKLNWVSGRRH